jgi:hypothetical protein
MNIYTPSRDPYGTLTVDQMRPYLINRLDELISHIEERKDPDGERYYVSRAEYKEYNEDNDLLQKYSSSQDQELFEKQYKLQGFINRLVVIDPSQSRCCKKTIRVVTRLAILTIATVGMAYLYQRLARQL